MMRTCMPSSSSSLMERSAAFAPAASGSKLTTMLPRVPLQRLDLLRVREVPQLATTARKPAAVTPMASM